MVFVCFRRVGRPLGDGFRFGVRLSRGARAVVADKWSGLELSGGRWARSRELCFVYGVGAVGPRSGTCGWGGARYTD